MGPLFSSVDPSIYSATCACGIFSASSYIVLSHNHSALLTHFLVILLFLPSNEGHFPLNYHLHFKFWLVNLKVESLPLKMIAEAAPITPKNGVYSGCSASDILGRFVLIYCLFPNLHLLTRFKMK